MRPAVAGLPVEGRFPSLAGATGWLNSPPLTPADLRGRVVLVDFWTYTCINWLRTAPYVRAWAQRYADSGLVVIGVHTPEFQVEHDPDNVRRAVTEMRLTYPVALDDRYEVWRAFDNHYWPALYLVDAQGRIRHHQFGEGAYEEIEQVIQQLLAEAGATDVGPELVAVTGEGVEAPADWADLGSAETYLGTDRASDFASPGGAVPGVRREYAIPARLRRDQWALGGEWVIGGEAAVLAATPGRLAFRFHARDLHLVLGPPPSGEPVRFRVRVDGEPPGRAHGADTDPDGHGAVTGSRLYQLVRQPGPIADRTFEIEFLDPGVEALVFTFG